MTFGEADTNRVSSDQVLGAKDQISQGGSNVVCKAKQWLCTSERLQLMNVTSPAARNSIPMIVMSHIECWMQDLSAISSEVLLASLTMAIKRLLPDSASHAEHLPFLFSIWPAYQSRRNL